MVRLLVNRKNSLLTFLYELYFLVPYGWYFPVTSNKSIIHKLHSTVTFNPCCLKISKSFPSLFQIQDHKGCENNIAHLLYTNQFYYHQTLFLKCPGDKGLLTHIPPPHETYSLLHQNQDCPFSPRLHFCWILTHY